MYNGGMKKGWKIILAVVLSLAIFLGVVWWYLGYGLHDTLDVTLEKVDLSTIADGVYTGEYRQGRFYYRVEVTIRDHTVADLVFAQVPRISTPEFHQEMVKRVKGARSLPVDTVTGATASSKAVLKAVENALKQ